MKDTYMNYHKKKYVLIPILELTYIVYAIINALTQPTSDSPCELEIRQSQSLTERDLVTILGGLQY